MPNFLMFSRLSIMLMPYLVLYRLSRWFSLSQGKLSQLKQYLTPAFTRFIQFLIRHETQVFDLKPLPPLQPGHAFSISYICTTEAAVHSAGSDQRRANRICLCRSCLRYISIAAKACTIFSVLKPNDQANPPGTGRCEGRRSEATLNSPAGSRSG